ncbi:thioesterase [Sphaerisporangium melleum]|uniref:Thioesterase n=1 Tax=Sphaerisporangium melleum TaxID=321316 RepID=A0A917RPW5_9ACTN|nr:alpha/beta fold hydrolase [Sphaerisporangium melleum]GGL17887.1 thioesterase [Sphaerisporangium melleum]GII74807.1 thioesterase [Sphaerisporangium melleum]
MTPETGRWMRRFRPAPDARTRLICFPHAGGSAAYFHPVAKALTPGLDVLAVQYPGRQERRQEPCIQDIPTLADRLTAEVLPLADRPMAFFGHSMGAVVAFEVARRLQARGIAPQVLFASGRRAPSCLRTETVYKEGDQALIAEVRRLGGTDVRMLEDPEIVEMILPSLRGDYRAIMTYRCPPDARIDAPVIALTGDADPHVTLDEAMRWKEHTSGPFEMHVYSGGHFFLNAHAAAVMRLITENVPAT